MSQPRIICGRVSAKRPSRKMHLQHRACESARLRPQNAPTCTRNGAAAVDICGLGGRGRGSTTGGCRMSPLMHRALDVAIAAALTAAVVFVIVAINSFLMTRRGSWPGFRLWYAFISRPDILGTMILTALVTIAYVMWQQGRRPGR